MDTRKEMASEAAATAPKARVVAPEKSTNPLSGKLTAGARPSLRAAIDAKCRSCIYDPGSGNGGWREQVQACSAANCPLHSVRPLPVKATKIGKEERQSVFGTVRREVAGSAVAPVKIGSNDLISEERRAA